MFTPHHHALLSRLTDIAIVAAFLALSVVAYGAFFIGAGRIMTPGVTREFAEFYSPGSNPWTGVVVDPVPPQQRFASTSPARCP